MPDNYAGTVPAEITTVIEASRDDLMKAAYIFKLPSVVVETTLTDAEVTQHMSRQLGWRKPHPLVVQYVRKLKAWSEAEVETGFPTIATLAINHLWSALESYCRDLVAAWLQESPQFDPTLLPRLRATNPKLPAEVDGPDGELNYWQDLAMRLAEQAKYRKCLGVARFEIWLATVGLADDANTPFLTHRHGQKVARELTELHMVRNCLAHHRGIVDRFTRDGCPWLNLKAGEPVQPTMDMALRYHSSALVYLLVLRNRVDQRFQPANGFSPDEFWTLCNLDRETWMLEIMQLLAPASDPEAAAWLKQTGRRAWS